MNKIKNLLLLFLCGVTFFTFACGSSSGASTSSEDENTKSETNELKTYKLNDDIYITNNLGKYRIKFTKVSETSDRNIYSDKEAKKVIIIEYEYENMTIDEDLLINDILNFKIYDKENNKLETYPAGDTKYGGNIGKGRKTVSSEAYALNSDSNYVEIEYYDNIWNSKPDCKIILEW